jgi:uncharacterized protein YdhG (YjbR/CyaY superfamily)
MQSRAKTVSDYLKELPEDRKKAISKIRSAIRKNLPKGYKENMNWGMISYEVPFSICPDTYNGKPLVYAGLASQKQHMGLYLMGLYNSKALQKKFGPRLKKEAPRVSSGKSCLKFKKLEDLPLDLVGEMIAAIPVKEFVKMSGSGK